MRRLLMSCSTATRGRGRFTPITSTTGRPSATTRTLLDVVARCASSKRGGSSSRYIQRQKTDIYVKQRVSLSSPKKKLQGNDVEDYGDVEASTRFVARSAFKLLQLDDRYKFLRPGRVIVDLGAAPGGWSQAIVERTRKRAAGSGKETGASAPIFALDLLPVIDIEGVVSIQGDFLDAATQERLRKMVHGAAQAAQGSSSDSDTDGAGARRTDGFVDIVVSDMMGRLQWASYIHTSRLPMSAD